MHLILFISLPLALYGKKSPGILVELIVFAIVGALLWGVAIILSLFSRRNDKSGEKEKSAAQKIESAQQVNKDDMALNQNDVNTISTSFSDPKDVKKQKPLWARFRLQILQVKSLAITSLVFGILAIAFSRGLIGLVSAIIAIIIGLIALYVMKQSGDLTGRTKARWGLGLGISSIIILLIMFAVEVRTQRAFYGLRESNPELFNVHANQKEEVGVSEDKVQPSEGTQWEYAFYHTFHTDPSIHAYSWNTPTERFFTSSGRASELWKKAGFYSGNKDVLVNDWFDFLGKQGWELIRIENDKSSGNNKSTDYWFKRPNPELFNVHANQKEEVGVSEGKVQPSKGTQWEYARYNTSTYATSIHAYSWGTPTERFFTTSGPASEIWKKAGFNFGNKDVLVEDDWFSFLGKQGWELICIEVDKSSDAYKITDYWFKRHKQQETKEVVAYQIMNSPVSAALNKNIVTAIAKGSSILINEEVVAEGQYIGDVKVVKISKNEVEFEKNGKSWTQSIGAPPNPAWQE